MSKHFQLCMVLKCINMVNRLFSGWRYWTLMQEMVHSSDYMQFSLTQCFANRVCLTHVIHMTLQPFYRPSLFVQLRSIGTRETNLWTSFCHWVACVKCIFYIYMLCSNQDHHRTNSLGCASHKVRVFCFIESWSRHFICFYHC